MISGARHVLLQSFGTRLLSADAEVEYLGQSYTVHLLNERSVTLKPLVPVKGADNETLELTPSVACRFLTSAGCGVSVFIGNGSNWSAFIIHNGDAAPILVRLTHKKDRWAFEKDVASGLARLAATSDIIKRHVLHGWGYKWNDTIMLGWMCCTYYPMGDLIDVLQTNRVSQTTCLSLVRQLVQIMNALHADQVVCPDLKAENICVVRENDGTFRLVLIDVESFDEVRPGRPRTYTHLAPHVDLEKQCYPYADRYRVGIVAAMILLKFTVFAPHRDVPTRNRCTLPFAVTKLDSAENPVYTWIADLLRPAIVAA